MKTAHFRIQNNISDFMWKIYQIFGGDFIYNIYFFSNFIHKLNVKKTFAPTLIFWRLL